MILRGREIRIIKPGQYWKEAESISLPEGVNIRIAEDRVNVGSPEELINAFVMGYKLNIEARINLSRVELAMLVNYSPDFRIDAYFREVVPKLRFDVRIHLDLTVKGVVFYFTNMVYVGQLTLTTNKRFRIAFDSTERSELHIVPVGLEIPAPVITSIEDGQVFWGTDVDISGIQIIN